MFATDVLSNSNWFSFFANCSHLFIFQTLAKSQAIYNSLLLSKEASEVSNVTIVEWKSNYLTMEAEILWMIHIIYHK